MITTLLWDVDGTLLDFIAAEKAATENFSGNIIWANAPTKCLPVTAKLTVPTG